MNIILEGLLKGLVLWLYGLILDGVNYLANSLLDVFNMDLSYFETYAPVTTEIVQVIIATGWALLIGNLVFQATRSMAAGIGFEGEDPKILFTRTFVFSFLLVASRQICDIGLGVTATVMDLLRIPDAVNINTPDESAFGAFDGAWLLVVIVGIILIWQIIKFFFEIGERYVGGAPHFWRPTKNATAIGQANARAPHGGGSVPRPHVPPPLPQRRGHHSVADFCCGNRTCRAQGG